MKQRVELLLGKVGSASVSPERVGETRLLELLERLWTAEATDLLKELAKGAAGAGLTEEAAAARRRRTR